MYPLRTSCSCPVYRGVCLKESIRTDKHVKFSQVGTNKRFPADRGVRLKESLVTDKHVKFSQFENNKPCPAYRGVHLYRGISQILS